jgi:hypothetical protein
MLNDNRMVQPFQPAVVDREVHSASWSNENTRSSHKARRSRLQQTIDQDSQQNYETTLKAQGAFFRVKATPQTSSPGSLR